MGESTVHAGRVGDEADAPACQDAAPAVLAEQPLHPEHRRLMRTAAHPFTDPAVSPPTRCRCTRAKKITAGMLKIAAAAIISGHAIVYSVRNVVSPTE